MEFEQQMLLQNIYKRVFQVLEVVLACKLVEVEEF